MDHMSVASLLCECEDEKLNGHFGRKLCHMYHMSMVYSIYHSIKIYGEQ